MSQARASHEEAHHGAHRGDLQALAADVADQDRERPAGEPPDAEEVATTDVVTDGLVDEADLDARQRPRRLGHEPPREGVDDPSLALEVERVGDRPGGAERERGQPPQLVRAEVAGGLVCGAEHAEDAAGERDGNVREGPDALAFDAPLGVLLAAEVGLAGQGDEAGRALAHRHAGARHRSEHPTLATPRNSPTVGSRRRSRTFVAPVNAPACSHDGAIDRAGLQRRRDGLRRPLSSCSSCVRRDSRSSSSERSSASPASRANTSTARRCCSPSGSCGGCEEITSTPRVRRPAVRTGQEMNEPLR